MKYFIDNIQGHPSIKVHLGNLLERDVLPQNLLFVGPCGIGKSQMALALAQVILCENPFSYSKLHPCGTCGPCLRVSQKHSESLCYIRPEKNSIGVQKARSIINFLQLQALGKAKIVIVEDAQYLNHQASNALLKTLEEPPSTEMSSMKKTYFIFTTNTRGSILPTLNSRFQSVTFAALSQEDLKKIWQKENVPEWMLKSCQGRSDLLKQLLENAYLREYALEIFKNLFQSRVSDAFLKIKEQKQSTDRMEALWITTYIGQFLRDILLLKLGSEDLIHIDLKPFFMKFINISEQELFDLSEYILKMSKQIEGYIDRTLLFEELVLKTSQHRIGTSQNT